MPDGVKKIGDAKMADAVVDAFVHGYGPFNLGIDVEGFGLTKDQCVSFGINQNVENNALYDNFRCEVLRDILNNGKLLYGDGKVRDSFKGQITPKEKDTLKDFDFSDEFIERLAGPDGARPLNEQMKFFGEWCVTKWWRKDFDIDARAEIIREMGKYGGVYAVPYVPRMIEAFEDGGSADIRFEAALALKRIVPFIKDQSVKDAAETKIGLFKEQEIPKLISKIKNNEKIVNSWFIDIVGEVGGTDAMPQLLDLVRDGYNDYDPWKYEGVLWVTFDRIGAAAVNELAKLLDDNNNDVKVRAARILSALNIKEIKERVLSILIDDLCKNGERGVSLLHDTTYRISNGGEVSIPLLLNALGNPTICQKRGLLITTLHDVMFDMSVERRASLGGEKWIMTGFVKLLEDKDVEVRSSAAIALGLLRASDTRAIVALISVLFDDNEMVRISAASALGEIGNAARDAIPFLEDIHNNDPSQACQYEAQRALDRILAGIL